MQLELCGSEFSSIGFDFKTVTALHATINKCMKLLAVHPPAIGTPLRRPPASSKFPDIARQSFASVYGQRAKRDPAWLKQRLLTPPWLSIGGEDTTRQISCNLLKTVALHEEHKNRHTDTQIKFYVCKIRYTFTQFPQQLQAILKRVILTLTFSANKEKIQKKSKWFSRSFTRWFTK